MADPQLLVVRDQFALKALSDQTLRQVLPVYDDAIRQLLLELKTLPAEDLARQMQIGQRLSAFDKQLQPVVDRLERVLPESQVAAFLEAQGRAQQYLEAVGATTTVPVAAAPTTPGGPFQLGLSPTGFTVTPQQLLAVAQDNSFSRFAGLYQPSTGITYGITEATARWRKASVAQIERRLRAGFLSSDSTDTIIKSVREVAGSAGHAQIQALVRTSMAQAAQTAHDAFNAANEDALGDANGNRYIWDASNDGRLCPICAPLDGKRFKTRAEAPWPAHWNERCKILPLTPLSDKLGALPGVFLEHTPAGYDKATGKLLPPPKGYDGDNAYKRPMKMNGEMSWVRRRDLPAGKTTAGYMLQKMSDDAAVGVLGSAEQVKAFRALTGPKGRLRKDPQAAVVQLLGTAGRR